MNGSESDMENELKEAKEHLNRAGYDTFEILASNLSLHISEKMKRYSASVKGVESSRQTQSEAFPSGFYVSTYYSGI